MGMYTQIRGFLNVGSINGNAGSAEVNLMAARVSFSQKYEGINFRSWVCEDTVVHGGANDSVFLFIGTELKNYNDEAEVWIQHLLTFFPSAEGLICFQYEGDGLTNTVWTVARGNVVNKETKDFPWEGYGNGC